MPLSNLTSGQPFKVSMRALAVFLLTYALTGWLLVHAVSTSLRQEIVGQALSESTLLTEIYRSEGRRGLLNALDDLSRHYHVPGRVAGLFDANGLSLSGPITVSPQMVGVMQRELLTLTDGRINGRYFLQVTKLDQLTLMVGRSSRPLDLARTRLLIGLLITGVVLTLAILSLGLWASRVTLHRLRAMEQALRQVAGGNMEVRLPVGERNDQFDRISVQVNHNLDRLGRLMSSTRATAVAIAHDLKTPLSHAQIAMHEAADACEAGQDPLPRIDAALAATETLNTIFETMLRISRIQTNSDQSSFAPVDLATIIDTVAEFMTPLAEANGQSITTRTEGDVGVQGDAGMLQQALVNLVSNATRYAGPGAAITLSAERIPDAVIIDVRDTGPGVPEEALPHLTRPFTRADAARGGEGNGLGLALVAAIADHHGARLTLSNAAPGLRVQLRFASES